MSQGESPEPEIGCRVGDRAQDVLDGVDALVDHHLAEGLTRVITMTASGR
jgi:hypothetical protein